MIWSIRERYNHGYGRFCYHGNAGFLESRSDFCWLPLDAEMLPPKSTRLKLRKTGLNIIELLFLFRVLSFYGIDLGLER